MKDRRYETTDVLCPFYVEEEKHKVHCEGIEDGMGTYLTFENKEWKGLYKARYCCGKYKTCRIYKALEGTYE